MYRFLVSSREYSKRRCHTVGVRGISINTNRRRLCGMLKSCKQQTTNYNSQFQFYETCTDVTSVLYILVCATRLFVYYLFNQVGFFFFNFI